MANFYPSQIIEYLYCPRFTFFEYVLRIPQYEDKYFKVLKGRKLHDKRLEENKAYLRRRIGVRRKYLDQYLGMDGLRGKVDEVLELFDGTMAPLDYKFAKYKGTVYRTYKQQLYCYANLIEKNFGKKVKKGYLVYVRSKNKVVTVSISKSDKKKIEESMSSMREVILDNKFPRPTKFKARCSQCTYRNICIK